jgi:hypothetical protein
LLANVWKVDKEPGTHVALKCLDLIRIGWPVILDKQIAILE